MVTSSTNKIKKITAVDQVYNRVKEMILNHDFKPGDKLPSEIELSSMFGVNRLTVRMAMQKLSSAGVLETKVGEGTYVKTFSLADTLTNVSEFLYSDKNDDDVSAFRKLLELDSCRLAILNASEDEIHRLQEYHDTFQKQRMDFVSKEIKDFDTNEFRELLATDLNFHEQLFRMSHNSFYLQIFVLVSKEIENNLKHQLTKKLYTDNDQAEDNHTRIIKAISDHNYEDCKKAYDAMLGK